MQYIFINIQHNIIFIISNAIQSSKIPGCNLIWKKFLMQFNLEKFLDAIHFSFLRLQASATRHCFLPEARLGRATVSPNEMGRYQIQIKKIDRKYSNFKTFWAELQTAFMRWADMHQIKIKRKRNNQIISLQFENLSDSVSNVQILNNIVQWWFSWNLENTSSVLV